MEKMDTSIDTIDFRLLDIDLELSALNYHLDLLEKQIKNIQAFERLSLRRLKLDIRQTIQNGKSYRVSLIIQ